MSEEDDNKQTKATRFQKILDKLELIDKKIDELSNKPTQYNKPLDKNSDTYRNKRNVYVNKLNNCEIKEPKQQTLDYYDVKYDKDKKEYV